MTEDLVSSLNRRGILKVPQLLDVPFATLRALTDNSTASRLQQVTSFCNTGFKHLLSARWPIVWGAKL